MIGSALDRGWFERATREPLALVTDIESVQLRQEDASRPRLAPSVPATAPPYASFLDNASKRLGATLDYELTLASAVGLAIPTFADWCAADMLDADGIVRRLAVARRSSEGKPQVGTCSAPSADA